MVSRAPAWAGSPVASPFPLAGVQRQVKVGAPGDAAEHEADRAADHVVSGPANSQPTISRLEVLQRQITEKRAREPAPPDAGLQRAATEPPVQRADDKKEESPAVQRAADKNDDPAVQRTGADKKDESAVQRAADKKDEAPVQRDHKDEESAAQRCCSCPEEQMQHRPSGTASVLCKSRDTTDLGASMDAAAEHAISTKDTGAPLRPTVRRTLESRMGFDLGAVRVHEGPAAHDSTAALNARAFTHKSDIWLGRGESQDNTRLMAHEVTHVVQQGAAVRRAPDAPKHEEEDQPVVRRSLWGDISGVADAAWDATGGKLVDAAGNVLAMGADFFWKLVQRLAPDIVPLIREIRAKGIFGYLRDKVTGAFSGIFGGLSNGGGFISGLIKTFTALFSSAQGSSARWEKATASRCSMPSAASATRSSKWPGMPGIASRNSSHPSATSSAICGRSSALP